MVCKFCLAYLWRFRLLSTFRNSETTYFPTVSHKDIRKHGHPSVQVHEVCLRVLALRQALIPLRLLLLEVLYQHQGRAKRQMHWANNKGHQITRCPKTSGSCWSGLPSIYSREGGEHGNGKKPWILFLPLMARAMSPSATAGKKFPFAETWVWCPLPLFYALARLLLTCLVCVNNTFCLWPWLK